MIDFEQWELDTSISVDDTITGGLTSYHVNLMYPRLGKMLGVERRPI